VVCDQESPDSHVRIITGTIGWWTWLLWWFGTPLIVKAPACSLCSWKLHGSRLMSLAVTILIATIVIFFAWDYVNEHVPRFLRKWTLMLIGIASLSPQLLYEIFYPQPFNVTAFSDSVDYEFTSLTCAARFAAENHNASWVKMNGKKLF
jgi:hypothetical protein